MWAPSKANNIVAYVRLGINIIEHNWAVITACYIDILGSHTMQAADAWSVEHVWLSVAGLKKHTCFIRYNNCRRKERLKNNQGQLWVNDGLWKLVKKQYSSAHLVCKYSPVPFEVNWFAPRMLTVTWTSRITRILSVWPDGNLACCFCTGSADSWNWVQPGIVRKY